MCPIRYGVKADSTEVARCFAPTLENAAGSGSHVLGQSSKNNYETASSPHAPCLMALAASSLKTGLGARPLSPRLRHHATAFQCDQHDLLFLSSAALMFDGAAPITGATGTYSVPIFGYYHSFSFLGRSANMNVALPYAVGNFQGNVAGQPSKIYRSGLVDFTSRVSVNLKGGPSMPTQEFRQWRQKTLLGVSLKMLAPTGQYDPTKLVNWGANRWAFKPELGYSRRWDNWFLDSYAGVWFYTTNPQYYSPPSP